MRLNESQSSILDSGVSSLAERVVDTRSESLQLLVSERIRLDMTRRTSNEDSGWYASSVTPSPISRTPCVENLALGAKGEAAEVEA